MERRRPPPCRFCRRSICPYCRGVKDTLCLRWWECPVFEHVRDCDPELDAFVRQCEPPDCLMLHGVCLALGADAE
eukprot:11164781-Lingulodinium_polyedra.AAC.1